MDEEKRSDMVRVVAILTVIILGTAGYFFTRSSATVTPAQEPAADFPEQAIETKKTPQENSETASWQTHTNAKYGYEIKYPEGMKVAEKEKLSVLIPLSGYKYDGVMIATAMQNVGVVPEPDFEAKNFQDVISFVDKETVTNQTYANMTKKIIKFNGYDAIELVPKTGDGVSGYYFVFHAPNVIDIQYMYPYAEHKQESYKMTEKILATFKFAD